MSLFGELKRRNVLRVGAAYVVFAWLVIQVVETIFPAFGFGDAAIRIATILCAIGLIPTLILAWAFELTPEGVKKEKDVDSAQSITPQTGKKLDRMIMVVLALALTYFAVDKFLLTKAPVANGEQVTATRSEVVPAASDASIAVLPFRNISSDPENEYFADGMTEEVMGLLANVRDLRVISRSSSFAYKDLVVPVRQIAQELNVAHILEGSVRRSEQKVRISVQLIDARSDDQQWSKTWEKGASDIFDLQNEVALEIAAQLQLTLLIGEYSRRDNPTDNLEAYHVYLRARELWWRRDPESVDQSIRMFERAIDMDPGFALANAGLASALYIDFLSNPLRSMDEWRDRANRAHELDPTLAEPVFLEADYQLFPGGDVDKAISMISQALSLEPNSTWINFMVSIYWAAGGSLERVLILAEKAQSLDPLHPMINGNLGKVHLLLGNDARALHYLNLASELGMGGELHWTNKAVVLARLGDVVATREHAREVAQTLDLPESYVNTMVRLADTEHMAGIDLDDLGELPFLLRYDICLRSGELQCAFDAFAARMGEKSAVPPFSLIWLEEARPLREQPGFTEWLQKNFNWPALMAHWTVHGWPDVCSASVDSLDCS